MPLVHLLGDSPDMILLRATFIIFFRQGGNAFN